MHSLRRPWRSAGVVAAARAGGAATAIATATPQAGGGQGLLIRLELQYAPLAVRPSRVVRIGLEVVRVV